MTHLVYVPSYTPCLRIHSRATWERRNERSVPRRTSPTGMIGASTTGEPSGTHAMVTGTMRMPVTAKQSYQATSKRHGDHQWVYIHIARRPILICTLRPCITRADVRSPACGTP